MDENLLCYPLLRVAQVQKGIMLMALFLGATLLHKVYIDKKLFLQVFTQNWLPLNKNDDG